MKACVPGQGAGAHSHHDLQVPTLCAMPHTSHKPGRSIEHPHVHLSPGRARRLHLVREWRSSLGRCDLTAVAEHWWINAGRDTWLGRAWVASPFRAAYTNVTLGGEDTERLAVPPAPRRASAPPAACPRAPGRRGTRPCARPDSATCDTPLSISPPAPPPCSPRSASGPWSRTPRRHGDGGRYGAPPRRRRHQSAACHPRCRRLARNAHGTFTCILKNIQSSGAGSASAPGCGARRLAGGATPTGGCGAGPRPAHMLSGSTGQPSRAPSCWRGRGTRPLWCPWGTRRWPSTGDWPWTRRA